MAAWHRESEVHQIGISVAKWAAPFWGASVGEVGGVGAPRACGMQSKCCKPQKEMHNAAAVAAERSNLAKMANEKSKKRKRKM